MCGRRFEPADNITVHTEGKRLTICSSNSEANASELPLKMFLVYLLKSVENRQINIVTLIPSSQRVNALR